MLEKSGQLKWEEAERKGELSKIPKIEELRFEKNRESVESIRESKNEFRKKYSKIASEISQFDLRFKEENDFRYLIRGYLEEGSHKLFLARGKDNEIIGYSLFMPKSHYIEHIGSRPIGHNLEVSNKRKIKVSLINELKEQFGFLWAKSYDEVTGKNDIGAFLQANFKEVAQKYDKLYLWWDSEENKEKLFKILKKRKRKNKSGESLRFLKTIRIMDDIFCGLFRHIYLKREHSGW